MYRQFENPVDLHDEIDIDPWPPVELVGRAVVLATLARRYAIELEFQDDGDPFDLETQRFDLSAWSRTELASWLTDDELRIIQIPNGELQDDDADRCEDAIVEGAAIMWALGVLPQDQLPWGDDDQLERALLEWAPEPWGNVRPMVKRVRIRSVDDLAFERERWELWYWRSSFPEKLDAESRNAVSEAAAEATAAAIIPTRENDFLVDERTYGELDELEHEAIAATSVARLRALNWVCGLGKTWESTPLLID